MAIFETQQYQFPIKPLSANPGKLIQGLEPGRITGKLIQFLSKFKFLSHYSRAGRSSLDPISGNSSVRTVYVTSRKSWNMIFRLNVLFWMSFPKNHKLDEFSSKMTWLITRKFANKGEVGPDEKIGKFCFVISTLNIHVTIFDWI